MRSPNEIFVLRSTSTLLQPFSPEEHSAFLDAMERYGQESTGSEWEKICQVMDDALSLFFCSVETKTNSSAD